MANIIELKNKKTGVKQYPITKAQAVYGSDGNTVSQRLATDADDIESLKLQLDSFTHLAEGSTTGDAELDNARTTWYGIKEERAGNAIRNQAQNLILVQSGKPTGNALKGNKVWIKSSQDDIEIPDMDDFNELKSDLDGTLVKAGFKNITKITPTWEKGGFNNSGQERATEGAIRTVEYINAKTETFSAVFNITGHVTSEEAIFFRIFIFDLTGTFEQYITIPTTAIGLPFTIDLDKDCLIRLAIFRASTSSTTIDISEGNILVTNVMLLEYTNIATDKTLSIDSRPADAKTTGESIDSLKQHLKSKKYVEFAWQQGTISSSGNNSASSSTYYIRTVTQVYVDADVINYHIASGYTIRFAIYNDTTFERLTDWITNDGILNFTSGHNIRITIKKSDNSEILYPQGPAAVQIWTGGWIDDVVGELQQTSDRATLESYMSFSIFQKFGVIGDSFASGSLHHPNDGGWTGNYNLSWPQILARQTGTKAVNFTKGGLSTKTWLENVDYGLTKLLSTEAQQLYIIALGINDNTQINAGTLALGTIEDVNIQDYTQNPDTFFGNYGRIIGNIKTHAPYAKIACLSVARPNERNMDQYIEQIANKYDLPFIDLTSDPYFVSQIYYGSMVSSHPIAYGYAGMAKAIERLIDLDVLNNKVYWGTYYGLVDDDTSGQPDE